MRNFFRCGSLISAGQPVLPAVCALLLSSCGYVGPIQPPALDIPQRIGDLRAAEFGEKIVAEFTIPPLTTEGLPLKSVESVELAAGVAPNPFTFPSWAAAAKKYNVPATGPGALTREIPIADLIGKDVTIAVHAVGPKGKTSDWSNLVTLPIRAALAKPADLKTEKRARWNRSRLARRGGRTLSRLSLDGEVGNAHAGRLRRSAALPGLRRGVRRRISILRRGLRGRIAEQRYGGIPGGGPRRDFSPAAPAGSPRNWAARSSSFPGAHADTRFQGYNVYRSVDGGPFKESRR